MKIDVKLPGAAGGLRTPASLVEHARDAEAHGYAGLWSTESAHDAFLPLMTIAGASSSMEIGTAIAVGEHMTEVAGAVCDGLMPHPFTTQRYLRERTLPTVERGRASTGRAPESFSISFQGLVVSGRTEEEMATATRGVRDQIAFYGS